MVGWKFLLWNCFWRVFRFGNCTYKVFALLLAVVCWGTLLPNWPPIKCSRIGSSSNHAWKKMGWRIPSFHHHSITRFHRPDNQVPQLWSAPCQTPQTEVQSWFLLMWNFHCQTPSSWSSWATYPRRHTVANHSKRMKKTPNTYPLRVLPVVKVPFYSTNLHKLTQTDTLVITFWGPRLDVCTNAAQEARCLSSWCSNTWIFQLKGCPSLQTILRACQYHRDSHNQKQAGLKQCTKWRCKLLE